MPSITAYGNRSLFFCLGFTNENKCVHDRVRFLDLESIEYHFPKFQSRMDLNTIPLYCVCLLVCFCSSLLGCRTVYMCYISLVSISISFVIHEQWPQCDGIYMFVFEWNFTTIEITNQLRRKTTNNEKRL